MERVPSNNWRRFCFLDVGEKRQERRTIDRGKAHILRGAPYPLDLHRPPILLSSIAI